MASLYLYCPPIANRPLFRSAVYVDGSPIMNLNNAPAIISVFGPLTHHQKLGIMELMDPGTANSPLKESAVACFQPLK